MEHIVVFTDINESDNVIRALRNSNDPVCDRISYEMENQYALFVDGPFRRGLLGVYDRYMTGRYIEQSIKRLRHA